MGIFSSEDVRQLLHNKYVAVLGDSIQRSVYKDLVKLLQVDEFLSENQLRTKGETSFLNDTLVEGGCLNEMHNGVTYREVRQFRTGHHLVRFYFLTRAYSDYMESILADFKEGPQPDVIIINSCIWDLLRYKDQPMDSYKTNLDCLFGRLTQVLSPQCLIIWNMTMPVGFKDGEFPEQYTKHNMRLDIVEGNFYSATLANLHKLDVLDMHYHFRFDLCYRCRDVTHWNHLAHRKYTQILMAHIAQAWGVQPPEAPKMKGPLLSAPPPDGVPLRNVQHPHPHFDQECGHHPFGFPFLSALPPVVPLRNVPHPQQCGQQAFGPMLSAPPPQPAVPLRNVPHPHPHFDQESGHHPFGHPLLGAPPPSPVVPLRNVPQQCGQQAFGPQYVPGYTAFDGNNRGAMIENFNPGVVTAHTSHMFSNEVLSFADDDPFMVGNFPPRNVGYGNMNANPTGPMFNGQHFGSMPIVPHFPPMLMDFGTFQHNGPMPNENWSGHQRFNKRRERQRQGWPYRLPLNSSRI